MEGFYGRKTMDMYAAKPGPNWGRSKKRSKSSTQKQITPEDLDSNGRRRTIAVAVVPARVEEARSEGPRRMSVRGWLARR